MEASGTFSEPFETSKNIFWSVILVITPWPLSAHCCCSSAFRFISAIRFARIF